MSYLSAASDFLWLVLMAGLVAVAFASYRRLHSWYVGCLAVAGGLHLLSVIVHGTSRNALVLFVVRGASLPRPAAMARAQSFAGFACAVAWWGVFTAAVVGMAGAWGLLLAPGRKRSVRAARPGRRKVWLAACIVLLIVLAVGSGFRFLIGPDRSSSRARPAVFVERPAWLPAIDRVTVQRMAVVRAFEMPQSMGGTHYVIRPDAESPPLLVTDPAELQAFVSAWKREGYRPAEGKYEQRFEVSIFFQDGGYFRYSVGVLEQEAYAFQDAGVPVGPNPLGPAWGRDLYTWMKEVGAL